MDICVSTAELYQMATEHRLILWFQTATNIQLLDTAGNALDWAIGPAADSWCLTKSRAA